jgi:hypothetical protein
MNHREAWDLIPWLVNGSIQDAGRESLAKHLAGCADCRAELQAQRALFEAMNAGPLVEAMPPASLQKLWSRIDAETAPWTRPPSARQPRRKSTALWRRAAAAAAVLLLGATLFAALQPGRESSAATYRTVTDPATLHPDTAIHAVFAGDMPLAELQALLQAAGLRIVAGPTASGVYTLQVVSGASAAPALETLRAHAAVRFAEPVTR